jgi:hypothetical protein
MGRNTEYLNRECMEKASLKEFRDAYPYPWIHRENTLTPEGFERLRETLPDVSLFERQVGFKRGYGQAPHNRCLLHYLPGLKLSEPWQKVVAEIHGEVYPSFLRRMLGPRKFIPTLEWYYAR